MLEFFWSHTTVAFKPQKELLLKPFANYYKKSHKHLQMKKEKYTPWILNLVPKKNAKKQM